MFAGILERREVIYYDVIITGVCLTALMINYGQHNEIW